MRIITLQAEKRFPDKGHVALSSSLRGAVQDLEPIANGRTDSAGFAIPTRSAENSFTVKILAKPGIAAVEGIVSVLGRVAARRGRQPLPAHLLTGVEGEDAVFFYLRRKGYIVVARRWSCGERPGDIDLIAWQGPMLCFVEVKTRTSKDMTPAEVAVDRHKRIVLRRLAAHYLRLLPQKERPPVRFDVVSVYLVPGQEMEFLHFENAFGWNERRTD